MDASAGGRSLPAQVSAALGRPTARRIAFAIAVVVGVATFAFRFYADDWPLIAVLEHRVASQGSPFDLYRFASGDAAGGHAMIDRGPWPWWTSPTLRLHLLRPLSSAVFTLDHALFGQAWVGYHFDALLWWLAVVAAAALVLDAALPRVAASLALLFFVIDDAHAQPVGWISCRHVIIAAAPALLGLGAYLRFRERGLRAGRWLGPLGIAVGLLGGETALGAAALVFAYELVGPPSMAPRREPLVRRLAAVAPTMAIVAAYLVTYRALGCGASESGSYVEPLTEPLAFVAAVAVRLPTLLADLILSVPADFSNVAPRAPFVALGVLGSVGVAALTARLWSALEPTEQAATRWLSLGAVLGASIGLAGFPGSRVLLIPGVAAFGVIALLVERVLLRTQAPRFARPTRAAAGLLVVVHMVIAPLLFAVGVTAMMRMGRGTERVAQSMVFEPPLPKRVYVLASSDPLGPFYASAIHAIRRPGELYLFEILSMAKRTHRVTRTGTSSLRLETLDGTFFDGGFVDVFRARRLGLYAGDVVTLDGASVRVIADRGGAPTAIELTLDVALDDPRVTLVTWQDEALRPVALAVGESRDVPWTPGPTALF